MTKTTALANEAEQAAPVAEPNEITLTEFCVRLSVTVRRPELISAFEFTQRAAGVLKAAPEAYQARFEEFMKSPV